MLKSFSCKKTRRLFEKREATGFLIPIGKVALRNLQHIHRAKSLQDLAAIPGNRLHALKKDRLGQHSISINEQYRICFEWSDGDAYKVEITDYH
jgi:proteic killer suppression protein